ncbi:MAG: AI-2E family transporter [Gammaproteobacteria bacterium]
MHRHETADFLQRVLIVTGVVVLVLLLWQVRQVLLLTFIAILIAVPLGSGARLVERGTGLSRSWALLIVALVVAAVIVGLSFLVGTQVQGQFSQLLSRVSEAFQSLRDQFDIAMPSRGGEQSNGIVMQLANQALSLGVIIIDALAALALIVVGGFFLAADPEVYRNGLVKLFPPSLHGEARGAIASAGDGLKLWLMTQAISMAIVGALVGIGTWLIGLPAPVALGLFAGISEFIPYIGPVIGALPAVLLAFNEGGSTIWWTLGLFVAVQQIESNLIMPLVGERMMRIPPALLLFAVVAVGLVFGFIGVLIAAPLTVVIYILVKKLYVRQALGEDTNVPGEGGS